MNKRLGWGVLLAIILVVSSGPSFGKPAAFPSVPNDPLFKRQWGLTRISAPKAWRISDGRGAVIAVLDTGVDLKHPDLASKLVIYKDSDIIDPDGQNGPQDEFFHGTHVAGIAAAITNNRMGVAGTAPGAKIMPVRVLDENGTGTTEQIAQGIRFAADHNADVINMSLGFPAGFSQVLSITGQLESLQNAIDYAWGKGVTIVASAGNNSFPLCSDPGASEHVVCVGATGPADRLASYSNFDSSGMDTYVVAPGGDGGCDGLILATYLQTVDHSSCSPRKGYDYLAGTSMAAPYVSGVVALLSAQGLTNKEIVVRLAATADDLGQEGRDPQYGSGRVNALKAVTQ
jgi:subtilisin family serine protease